MKRQIGLLIQAREQPISLRLQRNGRLPPMGLAAPLPVTRTRCVHFTTLATLISNTADAARVVCPLRVHPQQSPPDHHGRACTICSGDPLPPCSLTSEAAHWQSLYHRMVAMAPHAPAERSSGPLYKTPTYATVVLRNAEEIDKRPFWQAGGGLGGIGPAIARYSPRRKSSWT